MTDRLNRLRSSAIAVLKEGRPTDKCRAADKAEANLNREAIDQTEWNDLTPPERPSRPDKPELVNPGDVPKRRLTTVPGRSALLHAVAHIEFNAIDLAFDMVARFANAPDFNDEYAISFAEDWTRVGIDEARHFRLINDRLRQLDAQYGDLSAHDGLWEAAEKTCDDVLARLALAPMVLEARGLDVTPGMIQRLESVGDNQSADCLKIIYKEEVSHVAYGVKWFEYVCDKRNLDPEICFQDLVRNRFSGQLKKPFNKGAREKAGLLERFYEPLSG